MALTTVPASLSATALTLTTAAQPNITSVGTLTGLTVSGNIAGTLTTAAQPNITSVGTLTSLTSGSITSTGNSVFNGSGTGHAIVVNRTDGSQALRVADTGEVIVSNNYLYASRSSGAGLYVQSTAAVSYTHLTLPTIYSV